MSGLLPLAMLNVARRLLAGQLHAVCTITPVVDANGMQTWPASGAVTVACMKGNPGSDGGEDLMYEEVPASRFWVPVGTAVAPGHRVTWDGEPGRIYQIVRLPSLHADELLRPVDCIELRAPREAV
jgi:hypothetical protein